MALSISSHQTHDNNSMYEVLSSIDILTLVARCLANQDLIDLIRFGLVCKTWQQAVAILQRRHGAVMPWLFSFERSGCRFGVRDFWSSKRYRSRECKISPELQEFCNCRTYYGLPIFISKHGSLLISKPVYYDIRKGGWSFKTKEEFRFCNPFHSKIIELPCFHLYRREQKVDKSMINSTHPSLHGRNSYRVVAIISGFGKIYEVVTCDPRARNIKWTFHMVLLATEKNTIVNEEVDPKTWCSAYMDGTLYCCFRFRHETRKIGMFRIAKKDFGLTKMHSSLELEEEERFDFFELFECNGKLLLATRYFESNIDLCWRVYQFDDQDSREQWSPIKSLGNRALAISTWPSDFDCDSVVVVHEAKEFADMIIDGNTTYMREIDERGSIWTFGERLRIMNGISLVLQQLILNQLCSTEVNHCLS